jgi:hypothetical protein
MRAEDKKLKRIYSNYLNRQNIYFNLIIQRTYRTHSNNVSLLLVLL